jgi:hypothetical protein
MPTAIAKAYIYVLPWQVTAGMILLALIVFTLFKLRK